MPLDPAITFSAVMVVLAIATKLVTGSALNSIQRKIAKLRQRRQDLLAELGHIRERKEAARNTVAFYEARKQEVSDRIAFAEDEIRAIEAEVGPQEQAAEKTVGVHSRSQDVVRRLEHS